ncbi:hypothetical protein HMPREF1144_3156 [Klebsiella sp. OBRC7]|nr:hypothetical protein HMPREF1144_3156 [Klebsiella sp. OBRC7]
MQGHPAHLSTFLSISKMAFQLPYDGIKHPFTGPFFYFFSGKVFQNLKIQT